MPRLHIPELNKQIDTHTQVHTIHNLTFTPTLCAKKTNQMFQVPKKQKQLKGLIMSTIRSKWRIKDLLEGRKIYLVNVEKIWGRQMERDRETEKDRKKTEKDRDRDRETETE